MNNKYYLKGITSGKFFVLGQGFTAATEDGASQLTDAQIVAASSLGFEPFEKIVATVSWGVNYIRKGDMAGDGSIAANRKNPSKRRFAEKDEAIQHGSRFQERRKKRGDAAGTAGHLGFYVTETPDPVNASINWKTGLTNAL